MRLLIDADGCPVVDIAIACARRRNVEVLLICDTAHHFSRAGATTIVVSKGADSADFALVNRVEPGDIAITQDYGLAAMCLARRARILHQDGMEYTAENIDALLAFRAAAQRIRRGGGRLKGPKKRTGAQDAAFEAALLRMLDGGSVAY